MIRRIAFILALLTALAHAQTNTTNLNLALPAYGSANWNVPINSNSQIIDNIFSVGTCGDGSHALAYNATTKTFACQLITTGTVTGGTCTNQAVTAINTLGVPTCTTLTSAYVNTSIGQTGVDMNTSFQITATHLASALPVNQGGTGALTLTGPLKGNGTSAFTASVAADIVSLFSTCSGTQYLGADGACHNASAGGVTSVATTAPITGGTITTTGTIACATCTTNAASLTSNAIVLGAGSQATAAMASLGTTTTVLHGNAAGAPTFGSIVAADITSGTITSTQIASGTIPNTPALGKRFCRSASAGAAASNTCASLTNVATNDVMFLLCSYFLSDAGASTVSVSDTLGNSWTQIKDLFISGNTDRIYAYWAKASGAGADTFTCGSSSASATFWAQTAFSVVGASGTSPIDVAPAAGTGSSTVALSAVITTTSANDLLIGWVTGGGNGTAWRAVGCPTLDVESAQGNYAVNCAGGAVGSYVLTVEALNNSAWGVLSFAIH